MNAYAWNYTVSETSATLREGAAAALDLINYALSLEPMHVLALHLKIHLLETQPLEALAEGREPQEDEGSRNASRVPATVSAQSGTAASWHDSRGGDASLHAAEAAADALAGLRHVSSLPGHLIHMPAHIFFRVGRWRDGIEVRCGTPCATLERKHYTRASTQGYVLQDLYP